MEGFFFHVFSICPISLYSAFILLTLPSGQQESFRTHQRCSATNSFVSYDDNKGHPDSVCDSDSNSDSDSDADADSDSGF